MKETLKTRWYDETVKALKINGKSKSTQHLYARSVRMLLEFYGGKEAEDITEDEIRDYFLHKMNVDEWAPSTLKISYCGIRFFFEHVIRREWHIFKILKAQKEMRLPCVLSREEVFNILRHVKTFHNYTYLTTVYSCGLRLQEGLHLQVSDIDKYRMMIHIHKGKGAKDRYVTLPEETLMLLRRYWVTHRNPTLIFPALGRNGKKNHESKTPMSIEQAHKLKLWQYFPH